MDRLLEFYYSEHDDDILGVDIHMIQYWLLVAPHSNFHAFSTVLFRKYGGANVTVTNFMSYFSMFVPTKDTVKLNNGNTGHARGIGIIFCRFPNCSIICPVGQVYYCPGHPSNTISSGAFKFYVGFQKVKSEPLEHCDFFEPQGCSCISPYQTKNNINYFQI